MSVTQQLAERDKHRHMSQQVGKWIDHVLGSGFPSYSHGDAWRPAINLCEYQTYYCVVVDLAGMKGPQIDLRCEDGMLIFSGERQMPVDPDGPPEVRLHLMEIDCGRFQRAVRLPEGVDVTRIEAFYRGGYLWVRIPKVPR